MITVNEGTTCFVIITCRDQNGSLVTPSLLAYRVDDVSSGTVVLDWTTVTPSSAEHIIELTAENYIVNNAATREERVITVRWEYDGAKQGTGEYSYLVRNLSKIR